MVSSKVRFLGQQLIPFGLGLGCVALVTLGFMGQAHAQSASATPQAVPAQSTQTPLDPTVQIQEDQVSNVFRDMVVVQRKAKEKANKFLFSTFTSFDFSDGPVTLYGLNTNFGYAFSDFWEVYLNYVPVFLAQERSIVSKVKAYQLDPSQCDGLPNCTATITYAKPKTQYGIELLWIPAYGKDSWGPYSIVRSDTFFKFGVHNIAYDSGSGLRYQAMVGKTYFLGTALNFRISAGMHSIQTIVDSQKQANTVAVVETGLVFYF